MPLILAVEPDPLRLGHVTSLTRGRPRTDLLIAESVRAAISAIAARMPDVLLVSPSVSPEDRERLTEALAALGRAAAHVKVFTTPAPQPARVTRPPSPLPTSHQVQQEGPAEMIPPRREPNGLGVQNDGERVSTH